MPITAITLGRCSSRVRSDASAITAPEIAPKPDTARIPLEKRTWPQNVIVPARAVEIAAIDEVLECYLVTGQQADYMLKLVVPDMDSYQQLLLNRITRIPGVSGVHSSFVLRRVVDRTELPLGYLG